MRKVIEAATDIATRGLEGVESADEFIDDAEQKIFRVSQDRARSLFRAQRPHKGRSNL